MASPSEFHNLDHLLRQASLTFQVFTGTDAVLFNPILLKEGMRSRVVRCEFNAPYWTQTSLIVKQFVGDMSCGRAEWASLEFLSNRPEARNLAPRFYGGHLKDQLLLIEDLGSGQTLEDILQGEEPTVARSALCALATTMARLHNATSGRENEFESIRAPLLGDAPTSREQEAQRWLESHAKVQQWLNAVGCVPPRGLEGELEFIAQLYRHPEGFLSFTHGDPAPSNNHFSQGQARLIDFEYGGYRHALYDITAWSILCPLPMEVAQEMTSHFQEELAQDCPVARDEAHFNRDFTALCAYRALAILSWIPLDVLDHNRPWASNWTMREAVLVALSRLEKVAAPHAELQAISQTAGALKRALLSRWTEFSNGEEPIPRWAAFRAHGSGSFSSRS